MLRTAAVVTIGTELVEGLRIDTNTSDVSRALAPFGYRVSEAVSVGDDVASVSATLVRLAAVHPLVVVTGGLGPTHDDVTREALAAAFGRRLVQDAGMASFLSEFARNVAHTRDRTDFFEQALVVEGAEVLYPVTGTAPGQVIAGPVGDIVALPGPPREMKPLLDLYLGRYSDARAHTRDLGVTGLSESEVCDLVVPVLAGRTDIGFTVLARPGDVHVVLTDLGAGEPALDEVARAAAVALGERCYASDGRSLPRVVVDLARALRLTVGAVESCTGGLVASALTSVPGSSQAFLGGMVTYSNDLKVTLADVCVDTLAEHGAVSHETAFEMAEGGRRTLGVDVAVSVTGIAGPEGGSDDKPVGTVWFGLSVDGDTVTHLRRFPGSREVVRERSVAFALDLVRLELSRRKCQTPSV